MAEATADDSATADDGASAGAAAHAEVADTCACMAAGACGGSGRLDGADDVQLLVAMSAHGGRAPDAPDAAEQAERMSLSFAFPLRPPPSTEGAGEDACTAEALHTGCAEIEVGLGALFAFAADRAIPPRCAERVPTCSTGLR